jgi:hypothetical protein
VCVYVYNVDTIDFFRMYVEGEVIHITFMEIQYFVFQSVCVFRNSHCHYHTLHMHRVCCHDSRCYKDVAVTNCV